MSYENLEKASKRAWVKTRRICGGFPVEEFYFDSPYFKTEEQCREFIVECDEEGELIYDATNDLVWFKADTIVKAIAYNSGRVRLELGVLRIKLSKLWVQAYFHVDFTRIFKAKEIAEAFKINRILYEINND